MGRFTPAGRLIRRGARNCTTPGVAQNTPVRGVVEELPSRTDAMKRELAIKAMKREKKKMLVEESKQVHK
jgi:hypothetical protein